jgi:iron complex transport system ATP-binding protein
LHGITLHLAAGRWTSIVGPNGAGKSPLLRALAGLMPCSGSVHLLGRLPHQPWLSPPSAADHAAVEQALRATQAWDWRHRALGQLSGGERQRVLLARLLAVQAQVLLMDEPLANLDPPHQADWLLLVRALVAQGKTVVSVLHEVSFALQADDMVVLAAGRLLHHGACHAQATHAALEQVVDHRIHVRHLDGMWMALPSIRSHNKTKEIAA